MPQPCCRFSAAWSSKAQRNLSHPVWVGLFLGGAATIATGYMLYKERAGPWPALSCALRSPPLARPVLILTGPPPSPRTNPSVRDRESCPLPRDWIDVATRSLDQAKRSPIPRRTSRTRHLALKGRFDNCQHHDAESPSQWLDGATVFGRACIRVVFVWLRPAARSVGGRRRQRPANIPRRHDDAPHVDDF
jgi:hypothetical protein